MNPWPFVIAAYVVALGLTVATLAWAWRTMRRAERHAEQVTRR